MNILDKDTVVTDDAAPARTRTGNILVVTLGVVMMVAFLLTTSSEQVLGTRRLYDTALYKQKATYAAEAVAAEQEVKLVNCAATNDLKSLENFTAYNGQNYGIEWMSDCVVRWRIEPIRVTDGGSNWTVNPPSDVSQYSTMAAFNSQYGGAASDGTYMTNYDYYDYRITTEAWALKDPNFDMSGKTDAQMPWSGPDRSRATVQSNRVVQLKLNSLFKYAIFYAAEGPEGDIEWHCGGGATMYVPGAVHSNGAIYLAGGAGGNSPGDGGGVELGGVGSGLGVPTSIVGVDGIFRQRKSYNYSQTPPVIDPMSVPETSALNGGAGTMFKMNDLSLVCSTAADCNDSREPGRLSARWGSYVRDGINLGATVVKTLSNIPDLAGRPFEPVRLADKTKTIYAIDPSLAGAALYAPNNITINPTSYPGSAKLFYKYPDAAGAGSATAFDIYKNGTEWYVNPANVGAMLMANAYPKTSGSYVAGVSVLVSKPVPATSLPIYKNQGGQKPDDIIVPTGATTTGGFNINEKVGVYYDNALGSKLDGTFGLIIRERDAQDLTYWPQSFVNGTAIAWTGFLQAEGLLPHGTSASPGTDPMNGLRPEPFWPIFGNQLCANEVGGVVVINAQACTGVLNSPIQRWQSLPFAGFTGGSGLQIYPNVSKSYTRAQCAAGNAGARYDFSPRADYNIHINTAGTYNIYVRANCPNVTSNKLHFGFSPLYAYDYINNPRTTADNVNLQVGVTGWNTGGNAPVTPNSAPTAGGIARLVIPSAGDYVLHMYMAEDGVVIDEIMLTRGAAPLIGDTPALSVLVGPTRARPATVPALPVDTGSALCQYLKSQYAAMYGNAPNPAVDLTVSAAANTGFFSYGAVGATAYSQVIAYETDIMDRRESDYVRQFFMQGPITNPIQASVAAPVAGNTPNPRTYWVNTLTLNLDHVQAYIAANYVNTFNGLIYMARKHRTSTHFGAIAAGGYHPVYRATWDPTFYTDPQGAFRAWDPIGGDLVNNALPSVFFENRINNRIPDCPDVCFHSGFRIDQASKIDWGGRTTAASPRIKGLTMITPNKFYVKGNLNIMPDPNASDLTVLAAPPSPLTPAYMQTQLQRGNPGYVGTPLTSAQIQGINFPPVAVFCDGLAVMSNAWVDDNIRYDSLTGGIETWYHMSTILNNVPSDVMTTHGSDEGSGGVHNAIRYLENWGGNFYHFRGSLVCMGRAGYTRGGILSGVPASPANVQAGQSAYSPPRRDQRFNSDLLNRAGQPPFTPFGVNVVRTVSEIYDGDPQ